MKKDLQWFLLKSKNVHGEIYSYEKSLYTGIKNKLIITCAIHGDFLQTPDGHINKSRGCPQCGLLRQVKKRTSSKEEFIIKSKKIHNGLYSYDNVNYTMNKNPITITCKIHGNFNQVPSSHLSGSGCPKCKTDKLSVTFSKDIEWFISKAKSIHGNNYIYEKSEYKNNNKHIVITCKKHGDFIQSSKAHLSGQGCPFCAFNQSSINKTLTQKQCIEKCIEVHGNKYSYEKSDYKGSANKIIITCAIHGDFKQTPNSHWSGSNCPKCSNIGPSLSEINIMNILNENDVEFVFQKRFPDCRNPKTNYMLVFDFYLPEIDALIEYDGAQHFIEIPNRRWESLDYIQYKDSIKNEYCKNNKIRLIRIIYNQNIINRLKEEEII